MAELDLTPYLTILRSTPHRIGAIHSALKGSEFLTYRVEHDLSHLNQINRVISTKFSDVGPWKEYLRILKE